MEIFSINIAAMREEGKKERIAGWRKGRRSMYEKRVQLKVKKDGKTSKSEMNEKYWKHRDNVLENKKIKTESLIRENMCTYKCASKCLTHTAVRT